MPTQHTPTQLKQLLVRMLPDKLFWDDEFGLHYREVEAAKDDKEPSKTEVAWLNGVLVDVHDTELDYLCRVVEEKLTDEQMLYFWELLCEVKQKEPLARIVSRPPSQRIPCLAKVLGVEL